jgi:hypothetical protein
MKPRHRLIAKTAAITAVFAAICAAPPAAAQGVRAPGATAQTAKPPAAAARSINLRALAGWWIAIDDTFPKLWDSGVTPTEEVLIVNADGRFEDRTLNFYGGSAEVCAKTRVCADLPLIAYGRLRLANGTLGVGERGSPPNRLDTLKTDTMIRRAAFSSNSPWTFTADSGLLTLQNASAKRLFARVEPKKLQRLRAGMIGSGLPARVHWRCFLANAMAQTPGFAPLREERGSIFGAVFRGEQTVQPPDFLDRYLRVASYLQTLDAMIKYPQIDDPATRPYIGNEPEQFMLEEFPDIKIPVSAADTNRLRAMVAAMETRVRDKMKERAGGGPAPATPGRPTISDAEIAAFAQAASDEPAAKQLFCRE